MNSVLTLTLLCLLAFFAGLIDAVVGGGGLIQTPALFNLLPTIPSATLLGTNKIAGACGTAYAARSYIGRTAINWPLVFPAAITAFGMSFIGAMTISFVPHTMIRPVVLVLMMVMATFIFNRKDFGVQRRDRSVVSQERYWAVPIGGAIGFYDGLFGPGAGSLLIFLFIRVFAFDFVQASAHSKIVNLATNIAALLFFVPAGKVIYHIAWPMAVFNVLGAAIGARFAQHFGAVLVRILFLLLLVIQAAKFGYDIIFQA
jgi:uncharacterized protein